VKNVPGRKTDVNDATWLAELLAHGLVRTSFVPEPAIQELRGLLRTRKQLVREKASHVQRVQKILEEANIKIVVLSDVMGYSGRAIIQALIDGETDPAKLAALAHWKVRAPAATLREALRGRVKRHHRFLLQLHLQQINALEASIAEVDREADAGLACFRDAVERLSTIPGISQLSAQVIVSEIGTDMSRFATDAHLRKGHTGSMCLGRHAKQRHLLARPIHPIARPTGTKESDLRGCCLHPYRRLSHAQRWHIL
jgi:transposase